MLHWLLEGTLIQWLMQISEGARPLHLIHAAQERARRASQLHDAARCDSTHAQIAGGAQGRVPIMGLARQIFLQGIPVQFDVPASDLTGWLRVYG